MTTKTDITLPLELPEVPLRADESAAEQVDAMNYRRGWNACLAQYRAAVEADRADHFRGAAKMMLSDEQIAMVWESMGWDLDGQEQSDMIEFARALLSKYGSQHD